MPYFISTRQIYETVGANAVDILINVAGIPAESCDGKNHPCPACGGKDRFRVTDLQKGRCFCNQCFNHGNGNFINAVMHYQSLSFQNAIERIAEYLGLKGSEASDGSRRSKRSALSRPSTGSRPSGPFPSFSAQGLEAVEGSNRPNASAVKKDSTVQKAEGVEKEEKKKNLERILIPRFRENGSRLGMEVRLIDNDQNKVWTRLFRWNGFTYQPPRPQRRTAESRIRKEVVYEYLNEDYSPHSLVYRIDLQGGRKLPLQFHWSQDAQAYVSGKGEAAPIPYDAPTLKRASRVFFVEGEKCAAALQWALAFNPIEGSKTAVTCIPCGASAFSGQKYAGWFQGKELFVFPDNDEPGKRLARRLVEALTGVCARIRVYRWPEGTPEKWDIADEIQRSGPFVIQNTPPNR